MLKRPIEYVKIKYSAPPECCKCGDCQLVPPAELRAWDDLLRGIQQGLGVMDSQLAEVKRKIVNDAAQYVGKGTLDGIAKDELAWAKEIESAREKLLEIYKAAAGQRADQYKDPQPQSFVTETK